MKFGLLLLLAIPAFGERLVSESEQWTMPGTVSIAGFESLEKSFQELHWEAAEHWYKRTFHLARRQGNRALACKALNNVGAIKLEHGDLEAAETLFLQALQVVPGDLDAAANLASVYLYQARVKGPESRSKAIELYQAILQARPNFAQAWCNLGVAYADGGDIDKARECYARALELDPNNRLFQANMERE